MRMHGLAVIYENYKSPYDLEADEKEANEDPDTKLPETAWFRTTIEAGLSQTETVVGKYLGSRDREAPIGGTKILENVWKILPNPHGTLRHSKMYLDTSTRIHQKWRFTYPDPSWFEATGRDADLDSVNVDESWPLWTNLDMRSEKERSLASQASYMEVLNRCCHADPSRSEYRRTYEDSRHGSRAW
jgi:hypothetical protein